MATLLAQLLGSFGAKEVELGGQTRFSQDENPTHPLGPNNFFEYKKKRTIPHLRQPRGLNFAPNLLDVDLKLE